MKNLSPLSISWLKIRLPSGHPWLWLGFNLGFYIWDHHYSRRGYSKLLGQNRVWAEGRETGVFWYGCLPFVWWGGSHHGAEFSRVVHGAEQFWIWTFPDQAGDPVIYYSRRRFFKHIHLLWIRCVYMASYEARNSGFPSYSPSPHLLSSSFTQSNKACVFISETTLMVQSNWQGKLPIMGFLPWQFHDSLASMTDWSSRACFKILWRPSANVYWPTEHLIHGLRSIRLLFLSTYQWDCWFMVPTRVLRRGVGFRIEIGQ